MNIIFLTRHDPRDINNWSGTLYHIYSKLKERHRIEILGIELLDQLSLFSNGNFPDDFFNLSDRYVQKFGRLLSERINKLDCDLIFFGDLLFQPSDVSIPFVLFSDLTYEQVKTHYVKPDEKDIENCVSLEKQILNKAFKIIHCSEWIKNRVIEIYDVKPKKIEVVEFGANIPPPQNYSVEIDMNSCRLVFIGKDWKRKGGDKAIQIAKLLRQDGFPCTLTIIGSIPEDKQDDDLIIIPNLDKNRPEDLKRLCKILSESHFLVLPTKFDAFGIVFCEASAYALPSITADVGGVGQAVKNEKNGYLLPADATAKDYAEKIKTVYNDKESYYKLRQSSRNEFETRLNWDVWGERVNEILEDTVQEWKSQTKNNCK